MKSENQMYCSVLTGWCSLVNSNNQWYEYNESLCVTNYTVDSTVVTLNGYYYILVTQQRGWVIELGIGCEVGWFLHHMLHPSYYAYKIRNVFWWCLHVMCLVTLVVTMWTHSSYNSTCVRWITWHPSPSIPISAGLFLNLHHPDPLGPGLSDGLALHGANRDNYHHKILHTDTRQSLHKIEIILSVIAQRKGTKINYQEILPSILSLTMFVSPTTLT